MTWVRMTARTSAVFVAMIASLAWLHGIGRRELVPPPWTDPSALGAWLERHGAVVAAFALMRQAALVAGCYVLVTVVLGWAARTAGFVAAQRTLDHITLPALRRFLGSAAGAGVAVVALGGSAAATPPPPGTAVMHQVESAPTTIAPSPHEAPFAPAGTATMHRVEEAAPPPATGDETWTVRPGDSFWVVAHERLLELGGTEPNDSDVTRYWLTLIDANRDALPDRLNPDLLFPSAVLVLPQA
jgi:hypothetical protein